jgi:hypothetical protein
MILFSQKLFKLSWQDLVYLLETALAMNSCASSSCVKKLTSFSKFNSALTRSSCLDRLLRTLEALFQV